MGFRSVYEDASDRVEPPPQPLAPLSRARYYRAVAYDIRKAVQDGDAYYTIRWSPIAKADKYAIIGSVPAMGGLAELFHADEHGRMTLYLVARSYYGGLRAMLRVATDPESEKDEARRAVLLAHEDRIHYRYALLESRDDMADVMHWFLESIAARTYPDSGRYDRIFVKELVPDEAAPGAGSWSGAPSARPAR